MGGLISKVDEITNIMITNKVDIDWHNDRVMASQWYRHTAHSSPWL